MGTIYGCLGALAYPVNAYLGLRVVYRDSKLIKILGYWSLFLYLSIFVINWIFHAIWFIGLLQLWHFSFFTILYKFVFILIVCDDIVLIKWLLKQASPMADDHNKKNK